MDLVTYHPRSSLSFNKQLKLGQPVLSAREIAYWPSPFALQKNYHNLAILSIRSDGGGTGQQPPRKDSSAERTKKADEDKMWQSSDGNVSRSSNLDKVLALFKQIRASISKEETGSRKKKRNPKTSVKKAPAAGSSNDVPRRATNQVKGGTKSIKDSKPKQQPEVQKKNELAPDFKLTRLPSKFVKKSPITSPSTPGGVVLKTNGNEPPLDFKLTRLPSKFVKKSPIRSPPTPRGKVLETHGQAAADTVTGEQLQLPRVEQMKLPELKELAKARGIKGYSRMKKSELVELLRS